MQRKIALRTDQAGGSTTPRALDKLRESMLRAERIRSQQPKDKGKLYAPEVECIGIRYARGAFHRDGVGAANILVLPPL